MQVTAFWCRYHWEFVERVYIRSDRQDESFNGSLLCLLLIQKVGDVFFQNLQIHSLRHKNKHANTQVSWVCE